MDYDAEADKRAAMENELLQAQLGLIQAETDRVRSYSFNVPQAQASTVVSDGREVEAGRLSVTNPYPVGSGVKVKPTFIDAAAWEERYGDSELLSTGVGLMNLGADYFENVKDGWSVKVEPSERKSWWPKIEYRPPGYHAPFGGGW
jgi:hypothetical protein